MHKRFCFWKPFGSERVNIKSSQFTQLFNADNWASTFKISYLLKFTFKRAKLHLQGESVSILMFLLEPVSVVLGDTDDFLRLSVMEFRSYGRVCEIRRYRVWSFWRIYWHFLLTTMLCLTNSSILFKISVLLTFEASALEIYL